MSTYQTLAGIAQTWGLIAFMAGFGLVLIYALSPSKRGTYEKAARQPLLED